MKHEAKKAFYERIRNESETPETKLERIKTTRKKIIAHKYGITGKTKKDGFEH